MSARAIAIHGNEMSGKRRANLEIKSECPALTNMYLSEHIAWCPKNKRHLPRSHILQGPELL